MDLKRFREELEEAREHQPCKNSEHQYIMGIAFALLEYAEQKTKEEAAARKKKPRWEKKNDY